MDESKSTAPGYLKKVVISLAASRQIDQLHMEKRLFRGFAQNVFLSDLPRLLLMAIVRGFHKSAMRL